MPDKPKLIFWGEEWGGERGHLKGWMLDAVAKALSQLPGATHGTSCGTAAPIRCYPNTAQHPNATRGKQWGCLHPPLHLSQHFAKITEHFGVIILLLPFHTRISPGGSLQPSNGCRHGNNPSRGEEVAESKFHSRCLRLREEQLLRGDRKSVV